MSDAMADADATDAVWDAFRETIRTLYLVEDHSLEEVMTEMTTGYHFLRRKLQFQFILLH